jgi:hypothetical protein
MLKRFTWVLGMVRASKDDQMESKVSLVRNILFGTVVGIIFAMLICRGMPLGSLFGPLCGFVWNELQSQCKCNPTSLCFRKNSLIMLRRSCRSIMSSKVKKQMKSDEVAGDAYLTSHRLPLLQGLGQHNLAHPVNAVIPGVDCKMVCLLPFIKDLASAISGDK